MSPILLFLALTTPTQMEAVRERAKSLGRVEFAYEGEFERIIDHRTPSKSPARKSFSGRLSIDASQPIIVKEHHQPTGETLAVYKYSFTPKVSSLVYSRQNAKDPLSQVKKSGGYLAAIADHPHCMYAWIPNVSFVVANDDESKQFSHLGEEDRGGRRCIVVQHRVSSMQKKFWIDLERNALVLAAEYRQGDRLEATMTCVNVKEHRAKTRSIWLPGTVVTDAFGRRNAKNDGWEPTATPSQRWTTRIVEATLKIDDEAPRVAEVKLDRKEPIQDYTVAQPSPGPKSVHGPPPPVHKSPSRKQVAETITEADVQKAELQATLRPQPVDWTQRIAWGLVIAGVLGAAFVWHRSIR